MSRFVVGLRRVAAGLASALAICGVAGGSAWALPSTKIGTALLLSPSAADGFYGAATSSTNSVGSASRPNEIKELARALKGDPDLIYEHVRNNTEMVWTYGLSKGGLGVIIDHAGTAFDQAHLMVELLRESGFTASYKVGTITLTGAQFADWSGLTSASAACQMLSSGGIPAVINGTTTANCAYGSATITSIEVGHVWVAVTIGGVGYVYDPAYKPHTFKAGWNLAATVGLTSGAVLAGQSYSQGTQSGVGYVSGVSVPTTALSSYAQNLSNAYETATAVPALADVVGGQAITPATLPPGGLRQVSLPYTSTVLRTITGEAPDQYRTSLTVQITKLRPDTSTPTIVNKTVYEDEIYGRRLIFDTNFDTSGASFTGALKLLDENGAGPSLASATYADGPDLSRGTITLTLNLPYASGANGSSTVNGSYMDAVVTRPVTYALPFTIVHGFGETGRGLVDKWGERPDTPMPASPTYPCKTCFKNYKAFKGDGRRELLAAEWQAQSSRAGRLHAAIAKSIYTEHYALGISAADTVVEKTDPSGYGTFSYWVTDSYDRLDVETGFSLTSKTAVASDRRAAVLAIAGTQSTLKGSVNAQVSDLADTNSVATRFAWANAPPVAEDPFGGTARRFYRYASSADAAQAYALSVTEGHATTGNTGVHDQQAPILGSAETLARRQALADGVSAYVAAGFAVVASEEAFLGPGGRAGAFHPTDPWSGNYTHDQTPQRGGAVAAVRYDANGDPIEIADVLLGPNGSVDGGGGGAQTYHQHQYDPPVAADVVKGRFINPRPGDVAVSSPATYTVGNGGLPFALSAGLSYRPEDPRDTTLGAIDHRQPQSGWVSSWNNNLTLSGSGLEAMGETDVRAAFPTISAFLILQDVYKSSPSTPRDVTAALINAWWAGQVSENVVTVSLGTSVRQLLKTFDGSWFSPGGSPASVLTRTGARSISARNPATETGTILYTPTRGLSNDGVSFALRSAQGDVQTYTARREVMSSFPGAGWVEQQSYRLTNWAWPTSASLAFTYALPAGGTSDTALSQLTSVTTSVGSHTLSLTKEGLDGFGPVTVAHAGLSDTHTGVDGAQTRFELTTYGQGQNIHTRLLNLFAADNSTTPAAQYAYDSFGRAKEVRDRFGVLGSRPPSQFLLANGLRTETVDRMGYGAIVYADLDGRPLRSIDALGATTTYAYDGRGRLVAVTLPEGNQQSFEYSTRNMPTKQMVTAKPGSAEAGQTITTVETYWDPYFAAPVWTKDAKGAQTDYNNFYGLVTFMQLPQALPSTYQLTYVRSYYSNGLPMQSNNGSGGTVTVGFDTGGYADWTQVQANTWDYGTPTAQGDISSATAPRGGAWQFEYDAMRRRTVARDPVPSGPQSDPTKPRVETKTTYDLLGRVTKVERGTYVNSVFTPELTTTTEYDGVGNVSKIVSPTGIVQFAYDPLNRPTCTAVRMNPAVYGALPDDACSPSTPGPNGPDRISRKTYDAVGHVILDETGVGTDLQQATARYAYSPNGLKTKLVDANGNGSTLAYDGFDRLKRLYYPAAPRGSGVSSSTDYEEYGYDVSGNRTSYRRRNGQLITYQYNAMNQVVVKDVAGSTAEDVYYTYTPSGTGKGLMDTARFASASNPAYLYLEYDGFARVTQEIEYGVSVNEAAYSTYDTDGNRTEVRVSPAPKHPLYRYDLAERLTNIDFTTSGTPDYPAATISYGTLNRRSSLVRPNGTRLDYVFDASGRLAGLVNSGATPSAGATQAIAYNPAGQVVNQGQTNANLVWSGQPTTTTNFTHDQLNRDAAMVTAGGYDANGNLISDGVRSFTYDVENRLTGVTGGAAPVTIAYDPLGRIRTVTSGGAGTDFLYDGQRLVAEYNSSTGALLRSYVHDLGADAPLMWLEGGPSATGVANISADPRWLHRDRLGSVIGVSGTNGVVTPYTYGPYGEPQSWAGSRFRYTGQIAIPEAQLYHYKARAYDPATGRFLQTDPIGYGDGMNIYAYVHGDSMNWTDPSGLAKDGVGRGSPEVKPTNGNECGKCGDDDDTPIEGVDVTAPRGEHPRPSGGVTMSGGSGSTSGDGGGGGACPPSACYVDEVVVTGIKFVPTPIVVVTVQVDGQTIIDQFSVNYPRPVLTVGPKPPPIKPPYQRPNPLEGTKPSTGARPPSPPTPPEPPWWVGLLKYVSKFTSPWDNH